MSTVDETGKLDMHNLAADVVLLADKAGQDVMNVYQEQDAGVSRKADDSPLTKADTTSNETICRGLADIRTGSGNASWPILSEENKKIPFETRRTWDLFWLVDPLDGTKEFINKNGEFTINIALVEKNRPVLGVVYAPAVGKKYLGIAGEGAYRQNPDSTWEKMGEGQGGHDGRHSVQVVASRSHLNDETRDFITDIETHTGKEVAFTSAGSSLKFCLLAEGNADIYPRLAPTMEWDTGAAQAVVEASGGAVKNYRSGEPLQYNKEDVTNPWFIAASRSGISLLERDVE